MKYKKNYNLESVSTKNEKIFSPMACVPTPYAHRAHPSLHMTSGIKKIICFVHPPARSRRPRDADPRRCGATTVVEQGADAPSPSRQGPPPLALEPAAVDAPSSTHPPRSRVGCTWPPTPARPPQPNLCRAPQPLSRHEHGFSAPRAPSSCAVRPARRGRRGGGADKP
jgi:hypothetical protein